MKYLIITLVLWKVISPNYDYFSILTNHKEKVWWPNGKHYQGWLFRADSTFSYVKLNAANQLEVIKWFEPDISLGNGIMPWRLQGKSLLIADGDFRILHSNQNSICLLDPYRLFGRDSFFLISD